MTILIVFGTRPEAFEMAPAVGALRTAVGIDSEDCVSAQHRQMLDQVLRLVTGHRRENFGEGPECICGSLATRSRRQDMQIVCPVHRDPAAHAPVQRILGNLPNVHLVEPREHLPFVYLMTRAHLILTDSGGVQGEASSLGNPVLVMRRTTERPEAGEACTVRRVGTATDMIIDTTSMLLDDDTANQQMAAASNPYRDGQASSRGLDTIRNWS